MRSIRRFARLVVSVSVLYVALALGGIAGVAVAEVGEPELESPLAGAKTSRWLQLKAAADAKSGFTTVRFQAKKVGEGWVTIPLEALSDSEGEPVESTEVPLTESKSPLINWEVAKTFSPPLVGGNHQLEVRGLFSGGGKEGSSSPVRVSFDPRGLATDDAREGIGPGQVNLATGNYSVGQTDASVASWATSLTVSRAFNSRDPGVNPSGPLGPGWTLSVPVEAASDYASLQEVTDFYGKQVVELKTTGGDVILFYLEEGEYVPEPGYETMSLTKPSAEFILKDDGGNTVTFKKESGTTGAIYVPIQVQQPGSANLSSIEYEVVGGTPRVKTALAPVPANVSCASLNTAGCRSLKLVYSAGTTAKGTSEGDWGTYAGRLEKIEFTAFDPATSAMKTDTVSQYLYDDDGRLRAQWDPRVSPALKTRYDYDEDGRLSEIAPSGESSWELEYAELEGDGDGGRLKSISRDTPQGTATTTVVYQVPLTSESAPHQMGSADVAEWDQKTAPVGATAVFPPDDVPSDPPADYLKATVHYLDRAGQAVNVATPDGAVSTSEYDVYGNVVRELSPANRQRALDAGAESAAVAQMLDTDRTFQNEGTEMVEELGPEHQIKLLSSGATVRARARTVIGYDEGAPAESDFHLPTTTTTQAKVTGGSSTADAKVTKTEYDWTLLKPTKTIDDYGGLNITRSTTYVSSTGQPYQSYNPRFPKPEGWSGSPERVNAYYTASGSGTCGGRPQFANLLCQVTSSIESSKVPVRTYDYNRLNQVTKAAEEVGERERTTATTYDAAGRQLTSQVTGSTDSEGLVAAYGFEESSGTVAGDKSGNGNKGTLENLTHVDQGRFGRALDFDSGSDKVTVPDSASLDPSGELTLEAWVRPDAGGTSQPIISKDGSGGCSTPAYALHASTSAGAPQPKVTACASTISASASYKLKVGLWSHLTATIDASRATKIYVNGVEVATGTISNSPGASTGNLFLGPGFDGLIDEVRIYNRALSQAEVKSDMHLAVDTETAPPEFSQRKGLLFSYAFEEEWGSTTAVDSSGNGFDGFVEPGSMRTSGGRQGAGVESSATTSGGVWAEAPEEWWDVSGGLTVAGWFHFPSTPAANSVLLRVGDLFWVQTLASGGLKFHAGNGSASASGNVMTAGLPHYVAATFNGTSLKLYVDGVEKANGMASAGSAEDAGVFEMNYDLGRADEVRVYNRALSPAEIQADAKLPIALPVSGKSNGTRLPKVTTEYDEATGRPTTVSSTEGGVTRSLHTEYDEVGRVVAYEDGDESTSTTEYDVAGRPVEVTDGLASQTLQYDSTTGQLEEFVDSQAGTFTAEYDDAGQLTSQVYPNGMKAKTTYDETGSPVDLRYTKSGCEICVWYEQDLTESIRGQWMINNTTVADHSYLYDEVGRLTLAKETPSEKGCTTRAYTFDANSNRLSKTTRAPGGGGACVTSGEEGTVESSTYDSVDRITGTGFTYDPFGRLTSIPSSHSGGGDLTMSYYINDMVRTETQDGKTVGWLLDPTQTRPRATLSAEGPQTIYHYADSSDSPAWTVDYEGEEITGWQRNVGTIGGGLGALVSYDGTSTTTELQLTNLHGDVVGTASTNPEAAGPTDLFEADEFGIPVGESANHEYGWLGAKERRATLDSGVIQMGVRAYVPEMGRFTSVDPVYGGSANSYDYAMQDPLNSFDLDGEKVTCRTFSGEVEVQRLNLLPDVGKIGIRGEACFDSVRKTVKYRAMKGVEGGFEVWKNLSWVGRNLYNVDVSWEQKSHHYTKYAGHPNGSLHIRQNVTISACPIRIGGCIQQSGKLVLHVRYTGKSSVLLYKGQR